ncbi:DUF5134 domain-containing protein [Naumannella halotolerans]|uniref:DUF5134 domain-containing protein n=1 Tax=Naumannella halotolerans TaxID=993414 RepID=UPI00370D26FB
MLSPLWAGSLTVLFVLTGIIHLLDLAVNHRPGERRGGLTAAGVVDVTHLLMSIAMILMAWVMLPAVVGWAQIAIFAICALALLPGFGETDLPGRISRLAHGVLNLAMIWMLAAMGLLMGHTGGGDGHAGHGGGHGGAETAGTPMGTPVWAEVVNGVVIAACLAAMVWWIHRAVVSRDHRLPNVGHALMAAGMALMLWLMNA